MTRITLTLTRDDLETIEAALAEYQKAQLAKVASIEKEYRSLSDIQQAWNEPVYARRADTCRFNAMAARFLMERTTKALLENP